MLWARVNSEVLNYFLSGESFSDRTEGGSPDCRGAPGVDRADLRKQMLRGLVNTAVLNDPYAMKKKSADMAGAGSPRVPRNEEKSIFESLVCTNTALRRAARRLGTLYDDALAPLGLKATQVGLLAEIERMTAESGGQAPTLQDLATKLAIQISAVTHALRPLVRDGFVELQPDEHDRRAKRGALTTAGEARLHEALVLWATANQRVEQVLGSDSASALRALADHVASDEFLAAYGRS
jgi:DNA-binding MarR family transcriptional regulator